MSITMNEFISLLCESISLNGLWSTIGSLVPLIALFTLFALGVFFIVRLVVGIARIKFGFYWPLLRRVAIYMRGGETRRSRLRRGDSPPKHRYEG